MLNFSLFLDYSKLNFFMMNKYRHEYKYVSPEVILAVLEKRANSVLSLDSHVGENGSYSIRSIYFDDIYNTCYHENENGTDPREKFRIRIYNCNAQRISLELKQKENSKTLKLSCPISKEDCNLIMNGKIPEIQNDTPYLLKKLVSKMQYSDLKPVCIVAYERVPYIYKIGNVRVTFDRNIRSSSDIKGFFSNSTAFRPVMEKNINMMEVKFDELLPDYISSLLQTGLLRQTSFSKYYLCRKYNLQGTII